MKLNRKGFTLVEIMIVVAIIALLAVIAVPNLLKARETTIKNTCLNNQRLISDAIDQWALATEQPGTAVPTGDLIKGYIKSKAGVGTMPTCAKKAYTLGGTVAAPTITCGNDPVNHVRPTS